MERHSFRLEGLGIVWSRPPKQSLVRKVDGEVKRLKEEKKVSQMASTHNESDVKHTTQGKAILKDYSHQNIFCLGPLNQKS